MNINKININDNLKSEAMRDSSINRWLTAFDKYYPENHHMLTNFEKDEEAMYKKIIEIYGDDSLYISDKAYDIKGNILENHLALIDTKSKDSSEFWNLFDELKASINK